MATTPMDLVISQVKPAHQSIGLPTPSSLPARASHFPLDSDSEEVEIVNLTSESDRNALVDDNEGSELFELEREGEIIGSSGVAQSSESDAEPVAFSSRATLIRRPFRARYAMEETTVTTQQSTVCPLEIDIVPSFKRSFEEATRIASSLPEQTDDETCSLASAPSLAPPSRFRHSFDSQRAVLSLGTAADTDLDRRTLSTRVTQEKSDRHKRRRPSQNRDQGQPVPSSSAEVDLHSAPSNPRHRFTLPTLSLPGLTRPVSPVSTPAPLELSHRRATSFSHRLALPAVFGTNAQASSTAFSTLSPIADSGNVLRPRPARVSPDPCQIRQREDRRRRDTLERADELLDAAEDTLRRTRPLLGLPGVPRDEPAVDETNFPSFPSIRHLPNPDRPNETPPIIGVRLGEGWNRRSNNPDPILHIPHSLFDPPTPARTLTPPFLGENDDDLQAGSSANRSFRSLNLSTLRNRRNQSSTPPVWSESVEIAEAERLNEMLSRRRSLQQGLERQGIPINDESGEVTGIERRGGDARNGRETMLWGEVRQLPTNPRLRGPTERANERWRLHSIATTSTAPLSPLPADMRAPNAPPYRNLPRPSRDNFRSFQEEMDYEDTPSIWRGSRTTPPALSTTPPPRASHDVSGETEISPFAQRATSPSPSRRRTLSERQRAQFSPAPSTSSTSPPRRDPISLFSEESAGERRLRFRRRTGRVEDEEETTEARTWRPPPRPLRLPNSGSGRAIVFPHPAAVTGPINSEEVVEGRATGEVGASNNSSRVGGLLRRSRNAPPRRSIFDDDIVSTREHGDTRAAQLADREASRTSYRDNLEATRATLRRDRAELQDLLRSQEQELSTHSLLARSRLAAMEAMHLGGTGEGNGGLFGVPRVLGEFLLSRHSLAFDSRNYLDDDEFDSSYEALVQLSERLGDVPKSRVKINTDKFKKFAYKDWLSSPKLRDRTTGAASTSAIPIDSVLAVRGLDKDERCAICLADYEDENQVLMGDCLHAFHRDCLESWLKTNSSCPICRVSHA